MNEATQIIAKRISELKSSLHEAEEMVRHYEQEIAIIQLRLNEVLSLQKAFSETGDDRTESSTQQIHGADQIARGSKTTHAVMALLKANRSGLSTIDIVNALEGKVKSSAKNKRNMIRTTLYNMKDDGRITFGKDEKYRLVNGKPEGEEKKGFF